MVHDILFDESDSVKGYVSPCLEVIHITLCDAILQTSGLYEEPEMPWDE